jgi:hypothetical protein
MDRFWFQGSWWSACFPNIPRKHALWREKKVLRVAPKQFQKTGLDKRKRPD